MTKQETKAQIYNLMAAIMLAKATPEEIKKITKLAFEHDLLPYLFDELVSISPKC